MGNKIIVCGGNGAGKSTFGKCLAEKLGYEFLDIEDYYFVSGDSDYSYRNSRTYDEVCDLLYEDLKKYENCIFSSVKGNYGDKVEQLFTGAVYIKVPKEIRIKRVKECSFQKFGNRILEGGDLYEQEKNFFYMVEARSEQDVEDWLGSTGIPIVKIDGTMSYEHNAKLVINSFNIE